MSKINANGGVATYVKHDVASEIDWKNVVNMAIAEYGQLDIVVNNAGVSFEKPLEEVTLEDWNWVMNINVESVF
ncbi:hypothetical protein AZF37_03600 [endosymbiont 'TC1' of Trimyema compressum]|nr:hypothetical protein AZF37_03600 [endosymbiont 'TC1' of Trimyema compressum]